METRRCYITKHEEPRRRTPARFGKSIQMMKNRYSMSTAPDIDLKAEPLKIVKPDCGAEAVDAGVPELDDTERDIPGETGDHCLDRWLRDAKIPADAVKNQSGLTVKPIDAPGIERLIGSMPPDARGLDGIEIQYHALTGERIQDRGVDFSRVRLIDPPDDAPRYLAPAGSGNHVYIPAALAALIESRDGVVETLFVTEGEKKAIVGCLAGYPTVALAGITQWPESSNRQAVKDDAEDAGRAPERLSADTPIVAELLDLIKKIEPKAVHVLYDSDGAAVETREVKIAGAADKRFTQGIDKKWVMNPAVANAAMTLAAALRKQTGLPVSCGFVPHGSEMIEVEHAGKIKKVARLTKRGFDDWLVQSSGEAVRATIDQQIGGVAKGGAARSTRKAPSAVRQGYTPLGYSPSADGTSYVIWSIPQQAVKPLTDSSLTRKTTFYGAFGVEYCDSVMGGEPKSEDEDPVFDLDVGQRAVTKACLAAGLFSDRNQFGAGAWDDGAGGLEINCITGRFRVSQDGEISPAERVVTDGNRTIVFPKTTYGDLIEDRDATVEEIEDFVEAISRGWNFRNPVDGLLVAGWTMLQAYTACGPVRPNMFLTGPTSAGKTALTEMIRAFVGPWSWYVNDSSNASVAFLRGQLGRDVVTVFMDEAEPAKVKSGGAGRLMVTKDHIEGTVRALRASYTNRPNA